MATASKSYSRSKSSTTEAMWPANLMNGYDFLSIKITKFVSTADALAAKPVTAVSPSLTIGSVFIEGFSNIQSKTTGSDLGLVLLPVPDNVVYTDAPNWATENVGAVGKGIGAVAKGLMSGDSSGATQSLQDMAKAGKVGALMETVKKITQGLGQDISPEAITQGLSGKILNPYTEQIFKGIGMRSFDFSWKLVPRSKAEQKKIKEIIEILRKNALPNYAGGLSADATGGVGDRWLEVPNIYNLSWKAAGNKDIESLPKIKPCVCKNVQVTYTPDNVWATHMLSTDNPYPVAINLTLQFEETEIITGKDVSGGY